MDTPALDAARSYYNMLVPSLRRALIWAAAIDHFLAIEIM